MEPDPEPEEEPYESPYPRPRTRVGQFFVNAFRPLSGRPRKESYSSTVSAASSIATSATEYSQESAPPSPTAIPQAPPLSRNVNRTSGDSDRLSHSKSNEALPTNGRPSLPTRSDSSRRRSNSITILSYPTPQDQPFRRDKAPVGPNVSLHSSSIVSSTPNGDPNSSVQRRDHTPSRWRILQSFLSHNPTQSDTSLDQTPTAEVIPPARPRKGDVVCLEYSTLDDRGMRRLEGRSDHRPVIGSYAIYM